MKYVTIHEPAAFPVAEKLLSIEAIKFNYETPFTWSSGWKSPIYCDNRLSLSYPIIRSYVKAALAQVITKNFPEAEYIAGVATAGIPQGVLVADQLNLPYIYVRLKPKDHGMENRIEGKVEEGKKVVLIEDLISTGGSSLKAAATLKSSGFKVIGMAAIFTYGFKLAEESFEEAKIPLICLSDFTHLLNISVKNKGIDKARQEHLKSWHVDPENWRI